MGSVTVNLEYRNRFQRLQDRLISCHLGLCILDAYEKCKDTLSLSGNEALVLNHFLYLTMKDICLGFWCVLYDTDGNANTIAHLNSYLRKDLQKLSEYDPKPFERFKKQISDARNTYIAHWDRIPTGVEIEMREMNQLLRLAVDALNLLCFPDIDSEVTSITDSQLVRYEMSTLFGSISWLTKKHGGDS